MNKFKLSERYQLYQLFKTYLDPIKTSIKLAFMYKWLLMLSAVISPFLFKVVIDDVIIGNNIEILKWVVLGYFIIWLYETVVHFLNTKVNNLISNSLIFKLRLKIWKKAIGDEHSDRDIAETKNCLDQDVEVAGKFIDSQIIGYAYYWIISAIYAIILSFLNWKLSIFGFLMIPLSFWITRFLGNGVRKTSESYRLLWSHYEIWLQGILHFWKEIKTLNISKKNEIIFVKYWGKLSRLFFIRQLFWYGNRSFITFKDFFITRMNLYFVGGLLIYFGDITIGGLIIFMKYYELLFLNINNINNADMDLSKDSPSLTRVKNAINEPNYRIQKQIPAAETGELEFQNVYFSYSKNNYNTLKNISFKIYPGERIAIVGRSGSGKSTLIKILNGLEKPTQGEVLFNSFPVVNIRSSYLKRKIGTVMQEPYLFHMSVKENLMLGSPDISVLEMEKACHISGIHEFIKSLPEGYETVIGEKGTLFSGGQRQRLAIARTLLMNPDIIIFDESTSQLDNNSEREIINKLEEFCADKTIITITHRLSSISNKCRVLLLDNGEIIGDDLKEKLSDNNHLFGSLIQPIVLNS